ncbi:MAG: CcmD family protein [Bacteroidota bacterium]|nr:hypothetical protein [Chitinophagaceae bacterium]QLH44582.1 MAG: CcmD family protein [Bacteroidota bacterium]
MKLNLLSIILLLTALKSKAQATVPPGESAALLRENGQIYLVVLVLLTIFAGIIFMLVRLDRKISKLENKN